MPRARQAFLALAAAVTLGAAATSDAATAGRDDVARGLDLFIHAPDRGAPGATLPVQVLALGFPSVVTLRALEGAAIEAAWDPESLGKVTSVPAPVRATTDAGGRVHLDVPIPDGPERELRLLLGVRVGDRQRTQTIKVQRIRPYDVELLVPDARVVPGGATSAWVVVQSAATGRPVPGTPVEIRLLEGGIARHKIVVATDGAGTAMARVPIPWTDEPAWSWELVAATIAGKGGGSGADRVTLTPREETPGTPQMVAAWKEGDVRAGDKVDFTVRIRDGAGQPVAGQPVRTWVGPRGTSPPETKEEWEKIATLARTDAAGEVRGAATAPATVVQGVGTSLQLVAKATVEGHDLGDDATVAVENPSSSASLEPEGGAIVPGLEQRMLLRVLDARFDPVAATFTVEADGLRATATTDAYGEAEITWKPPADLGAFRNVGPCAGGVAAAVLVRPASAVPALASRRGPFELCVSVNREAAALVRPEPLLARIGDRPLVRVIEAGKGARGPLSPWSVVVQSNNLAGAASFWIDDGEKGGGLELGEGAPGVWNLSAASPRIGGPARVRGGAMFVTPRVLPALGAKIAGGRAAPKGTIDVDLQLGDGKGGGLPGTISAVVVDLFGGGSVRGLEALDTRRRLCGQVGVERERCDRFLEGDPALDPLLRASLGDRFAASVAPARDPGGSAREELDKAFGEVLRSLEGAVFEAAESPDRLQDVRRRGAGGAWQFNPELMTLVTAAMAAPPVTPGGEPLALADLLAIDPQVTFDNVARRITRLKLFRILAAVRAYRRERQLDPDEPALRDPNALLRRAVRDEQVPESLLVDPWGGTIQFVKSGAPPFPFLTVTRGFALQAPGPDGRIGSGDDVRDPFERVLRSDTPYARALGEDQLVDAKLDMEVSDATVSAWETLIEEATGIALGNVGTIGHGSGTGTGQGYGSGSGRLGGSSRTRGSFGIPTGVAYWSPPRRTDASGRLRMAIPLGDVETTWRIAFVGVPDGAMPATTSLDVPVALPLSARVDTGAAWIEGDEMEASVTVRNRSAGPARATLSFAAGGVAALADPRQKGASVDVAAGGAAVARVRLRAARPGKAELRVSASAPGVASDQVVHTWDVRPAGEPTDMTSSMWVEGTTSVGGIASPEALTAGPTTLSVPATAKGLRLIKEPRVVLERGVDSALEAALEAMDPDRLSSPDAMADAVEVGTRLARWATARRGEESPLAARGREIARRAVGRLLAYKPSKKAVVFWAAESRVRSIGPADLIAELPKGEGSCPPKRPPLDEALDGLDAEPAPASGVAEACWDAFVTETAAAATQGGDRVDLARAVLSLAERPHRAASATALADRLREAVALRPTGGISLPPHQAADRASRAIVYAALLRGAGLGKGAAPADRLAAWLAVQRDARGGYGSALATRSAVRALLAQGDGPQGPTKVTIVAAGARREVEVGPSARVVVPLDPAATRVEISGVGPSLLARLERPVLRLWSSPPDDAASPVHLEVTWPKRPRAGKTGVVQVSVRQGRDRPSAIDVRIPLPPGVSLAAPVKGVHQIQGTLVVRADLDASRLPTVLEIPVRFALAGQVTVPEARARVAFEELARAVAPARPLRIE